MEKYEIKNLDCANCAFKIESELKKMKIVNSVSVNFATETMHIDTSDMNKVKEKIKLIEPDVEIVDKYKGNEIKEDSGNSKIELILIITGFILFIPGLIFQEFLHTFFYEIAEYILFIGIFLLAGWKVLFSAVKNILKGKIFDENFLMTIATTGAIVIHALPEAAGVMLFYKLGTYFEKLSVTRSRKSITSLLAMKPDYARLKTEKGFEKVHPDQVKINSEVLVKVGERVPLDGIILNGESSIDMSTLTGESVPKKYKAGDKILSGSICLSGSLRIQVIKPFKESSLSRIMNLVENAVQKKAPTERFISSFAKIYTPIIVLIALGVAVIPPVFFNRGDFITWIYRALVILVISCPCALVLSIPLGYFAGLGIAAKKGILIKGSNHIDMINKLGSVVFDKTGTLTKGVFTVTKVVSRNGFLKEDVLTYAAYAEANSNHPIAASIKLAYKKKIDETKIVKYKEIAGYGVKASIPGYTILVGNDKFLHRENIKHEDCDITRTVAYVIINNVYAGHIIISDMEKEDSKKTIEELKKAGINTIAMLTGDNKNVAGYYAEKLGIDTYYSELLPEDKLMYLNKIKTENKKNVAFVGDGINDGPVIASADVGISMGKHGSDIAIEIADVVLMNDAPSKLIDAIKISKKTKFVILQNIFLAIIIKIAFIAFGAFGLAGMWEAVFADVGVTLLAVFNTMRINKQ